MIFKFQTLITLLFAGALALAVGGIRPLPPLESEEAFWARKMLWGPEFDVVLAGDSRTNRGLSPAAMETQLPGYRIANFAFMQVAMNREYLGEVERRLDPQGRRIVVLGVTTVSLTPKAASDSKFIEMKRKHAVELQQEVGLEELFKYFRPFDWAAINRPLYQRQGSKTTIYYPDGWKAIVETRMDPQRRVETGKKFYSDNWISEEIIDELIETVEEWTAKGITVFGLRPPTVVDLYDVENEMSGFNEEEFIKRFRKAGGVWLHFQHGLYTSYDGSHLQAPAARKLSRQLAREIALVLAEGGR